MVCMACNSLMSDRAASRKYASTGAYIDLCDSCFFVVKDDIPYIENRSLVAEIIIEENDILENE